MAPAVAGREGGGGGEVVVSVSAQSGVMAWCREIVEKCWLRE